jgi:hypothetical protein
MDASHFDRIVRTWAEAGSRRPILGLLAGGVAGLAGLTEASGKRKKKKKKVTLCLNGATITVPKKKQGSYLSQGATAGKCPATCVRQCTGKTCGPDGCGGSCGGCPEGKTCQGGACACPAGEFECETNVCVPLNAVCCTDGQCSSGKRCLHGQCVTWQGTCPAGADFCIAAHFCPGTDNCLCVQSTEGETRCGSGVGIKPPCEVCDTTADCEAQFPDIPGVFCVETGNGPNCCEGACVRPCPSA